MLFNSLAFVGLVSVSLLLYYIPRFSRYQVVLLIAASLFFYAFHKPTLVVLLLISAGINIITSYYVVYGRPERRKLLAIVGVSG